MRFTFNGVKRDGNGAYYYNDGDVESHRIPLSDQCYGDVRMSREQLEEWFGIRNDTLPDLPAYYILPRLDSTWGGTAGVFDGNKELKDLHITLSNVGWTDWYAYVAGKKGPSSGRQLLAYPNYCPTTTLMLLNKTPPKTE
ncbi:hypothetical protein FAGAP_1285 [Fusarium agapanthi]|uniref:Uncharacterized protein n=1 Tax=Fusarium agapanthi TaxID=1803897 RepID=A0A9P5BHS2_9HYPO|nr:hypothetical protein FAGAP_1285 [Fusarium agapanthi]